MPPTVKRKDKKGTAERILEAALACFAKGGFAGTSTRTLADAAGVNVATLAYHFKDKEGLYKAAVDSIYEQFFAVTPTSISQPKPSRPAWDRRCASLTGSRGSTAWRCAS